MIAERQVYRRPKRGHVLVTAAVVRVFQKHRQLRWHSPESGGVILGRIMAVDDDIIFDDASEPTALDRAGRFFFRRARSPAQRAINDAWETSDGMRNYLGEWHTHPERHPTPSSHDRDDWLRICSTANFEQESLFFAIVGQESTAIWELSRSERMAKVCLPLIASPVDGAPSASW